MWVLRVQSTCTCTHTHTHMHTHTYAANSLETISAAYALGLGTFVDKPTLPFATTSNTVSE